MQEYEHFLARLQDFLSYEEVINNAEVINAYDYINLLRKEYNKSRKPLTQNKKIFENLCSQINSEETF